jgi:hypothetical protein
MLIITKLRNLRIKKLKFYIAVFSYLIFLSVPAILKMGIKSRKDNTNIY